MTMDVSNRKPDVTLSSKTFEDQRTSELPVRAKRSFDVAFLMLPDEKLKQKEATKMTKYCAPVVFDEAAIANEDTASIPQDSDEDEEIEVDKIEYVKMHPGKYYSTQRQQIFGDPHLSKPDNYKVKIPTISGASANQKSAFTKVSLKDASIKEAFKDTAFKDTSFKDTSFKDTSFKDASFKEAAFKDASRLSPNLSISPDLSYQNSLSPSPPITGRSYQHYHGNALLSPSNLFKGHSYQSHFEGFPHQENPFVLKSPEQILQQQPQHFAGKIRSTLPHQYRPELAYGYAPFASSSPHNHHHHQEMLKPSPSSPAEMRNPAAAAAILSSLLPPSLAALSLPAQNVCAKCNISFRMTSDLVYHMRSHHKNDHTDYTRKKREDKLKCPVCAESFRERHHLTRHMTAHQDKDNDNDEPAASAKKKHFVPAYNNNANK